MIGDIFPEGWTILTVDGTGRAVWDKQRDCWLIAHDQIHDGVPGMQLASLAECRSFFERVGSPLETEEARKDRLIKHRDSLPADLRHYTGPI